MRRYAALSTALTVSQSLWFTILDMQDGRGTTVHTPASCQGGGSRPPVEPPEYGRVAPSPQPKLAALDRLAERRLS